MLFKLQMKVSVSMLTGGHISNCMLCLPPVRCLEQLLGGEVLPADDRETVAAMLACACSGPSRAPLLRAILDALGGADKAGAAMPGAATRPAR